MSAIERREHSLLSIVPVFSCEISFLPPATPARCHFFCHPPQPLHLLLSPTLPSVAFNLLSITKACKSGAKVEFDDGTCTMKWGDRVVGWVKEKIRRVLFFIFKVVGPIA